MAADNGGRRRFLRNALTAIRDFFFERPVENRYEAAEQSWNERSWLPAAVQDARFDADASTRLELVRRSRYWERNNAIVNRLADVFEQFTVGPGLQIVPKTDDEDFNLSAGRWWENWCKWPDVSSGLNFGVIQGQMARALFVDGEIFIYKTFSRETGRPRIQLIESHRIGTPPHLQHEEGRSIVDGIEFAPDKNNAPSGRPLRYWVRTDNFSFLQGQSASPANGQGIWEPIEADRMLHLFEPCRPGMVRGLPMLYPVMNDLHDLDDLQALEMKAAKNNAEVANVVTNKTGEANVKQARRQNWQINSQNAAGGTTTKQAPLFYEQVVGGRTVYVATGEKFEQFKSDRPGAATRDYWDYLVRKICAGVGISALLVLPFSLQGTVTRADLDVAAAFFRSKSSLIAAVLREVYMWAMGWAVKYDRSLDGAPREWWPVAIRPPRSVNVDVGRNSAAILDEMEAGVRTFQDVCGELGYDWREVLKQKAIEAKFIDNLAKEFNINRDYVSHFTMPTPLEGGESGSGEPPAPPPGRQPTEPPDPFQKQPSTKDSLRDPYVYA